jgi:hypothetical protein
VGIIVFVYYQSNRLFVRFIFDFVKSSLFYATELFIFVCFICTQELQGEEGVDFCKGTVDVDCRIGEDIFW